MAPRHFPRRVLFVLAEVHPGLGPPAQDLPLTAPVLVG
jgi:hypothetical protein